MISYDSAPAGRPLFETSTEPSATTLGQVSEIVTGDFDLSMDELRAVTQFVWEAAQPLVAVYERAVADDDRPRSAVDAARRFIDGERRTKLQRVTSIDAHRAAASAPTEVARLCAQAAGDAASAAYLHPSRRAHQVGHILRAAANAARVAEVLAGDAAAASAQLLGAQSMATDVLVDVLSRYPPTPPGRSRCATLMYQLDECLRVTG